jgi:hypothetical protein
LKILAKIGLRGLRDIGTVRTVVAKQQKNDRSHIVGKYARLDAERTRIEREIEMWSTRKVASEVRLTAILKEIDIIRPSLISEPQEKNILLKEKRVPLSESKKSNTIRYNSVLLNY